MISKAYRVFDDALFGPEAPARLLVVQTGLIVVIGLRIALSPFPDLTPQPRALFQPVPFLSFLRQMPPLGVIIALQVLGVLCAIGWLAVGRVPSLRARGRRVLFVLTWLCLLALVGFRASRGKILHNDLLLIWGSLPFLFAPGDATFADRSPRRRYGWSIRTAIVIISVAYFFTAFWKLDTSGLNWVFGDNMRWILYKGATTEAPFPDLAIWIANHSWLAVAFAAGLVLYEITFWVVIFWKRIRPVYVVAAWLIHAGTYLVLDLDYIMYASVVTLLLLNWPPLIDHISGRVTRRTTSRSGRVEIEPTRQ